jgi:hypothetical protein
MRSAMLRNASADRVEPLGGLRGRHLDDETNVPARDHDTTERFGDSRFEESSLGAHPGGDDRLGETFTRDEAEALGTRARESSSFVARDADELLRERIEARQASATPDPERHRFREGVLDRGLRALFGPDVEHGLEGLQPGVVDRAGVTVRDPWHQRDRSGVAETRLSSRPWGWCVIAPGDRLEVGREGASLAAPDDLRRGGFLAGAGHQGRKV